MTFILFKNIISHYVAIRMRKINVKIRRILSRGIDESLEVQVQLYGVHICDTQTVGDDTIGAAAPTDIEETLLASEAYDVPVDQKVCCESQLIDRLQL